MPSLWMPGLDPGCQRPTPTPGKTPAPVAQTRTRGAALSHPESASPLRCFALSVSIAYHLLYSVASDRRLERRCDTRKNSVCSATIPELQVIGIGSDPCEEQSVGSYYSLEVHTGC